MELNQLHSLWEIWIKYEVLTLEFGQVSTKKTASTLRTFVSFASSA